MDSPRPLLDAELQFFMKGTGKGKLQSILMVFGRLLLSIVLQSNISNILVAYKLVLH